MSLLFVNTDNEEANDQTPVLVPSQKLSNIGRG